ncbi:hypothetical protein XCR_2894 [Xanthomonas campestris pv. raphani 756C]|nr:hypothetical protein XCR_2894 [Xanthomonas campestris pv. raphani 756C]
MDLQRLSRPFSGFPARARRSLRHKHSKQIHTLRGHRAGNTCLRGTMLASCIQTLRRARPFARNSGLKRHRETKVVVATRSRRRASPPKANAAIALSPNAVPGGSTSSAASA